MTKVKAAAPGRNILTAFSRTKLAEGVQAYFGVAAATQINGMHVMIVAESVENLASLYQKMVGVELNRHLCYKVGVTDGAKLRAAQWGPNQTHLCDCGVEWGTGPAAICYPEKRDPNAD